MSWHDLPLNVVTLEAETVNEVEEDIEYLRTAAIAAGVTVDVLNTVNAQMDTPTADVRGKLQAVEDNFTILKEDVTESLYYDEDFPWYGQGFTIFSLFKRENFRRWVLMLRDLYDIIVNGKGQWGQMYLTLEQGQPDVQINGNDVYIRGDVIG